MPPAGVNALDNKRRPDAMAADNNFQRSTTNGLKYYSAHCRQSATCNKTTKSFFVAQRSHVVPIKPPSHLRTTYREYKYVLRVHMVDT